MKLRPVHPRKPEPLTEDVRLDVLQAACTGAFREAVYRWDLFLSAARRDHLPASAMVGVPEAARQAAKSESREWTRQAAHQVGDALRLYRAAMAWRSELFLSGMRRTDAA